MGRCFPLDRESKDRNPKHQHDPDHRNRFPSSDGQGVTLSEKYERGLPHFLGTGAWVAPSNPESGWPLPIRIYAIRPEARSRMNTAYMVAYFIGGSLGSYGGAWGWGRAGWSGGSAWWAWA